MAKARLVHFLNQFFAGEGGEEQADLPMGVKEGPVGPGRRLQALLGNSAEIVATAYCGDNYFASHAQEVTASALRLAAERDIGLLVAGPSFQAGRYGFACVELCHAAATSLGLPCVTGMHVENPAVDGYRQYHDRSVFALPTSDNASGMEDALSKMAGLIAKLASGSAIGPAAEEGYIARGIRVPEFKDKIGAERAIDVLLSKAARRPFVTEIPVDTVEAVPIPAKMGSLKGARIALGGTAGIVPPGNPDGFKGNRNTIWKKYSIEGLNSMQDVKWEVMHGGYNTVFMEENANYGVPLDACRQLEKEGAFAGLYPYHYSTTGVGALYSDMQAIGLEMVQEMKAEGIDAAIMVST